MFAVNSDVRHYCDCEKWKFLGVLSGIWRRTSVLELKNEIILIFRQPLAIIVGFVGEKKELF